MSAGMRKALTLSLLAATLHGCVFKATFDGPDAGPDGGPPDAGPPDAGPPDGGPPDACVPSTCAQLGSGACGMVADGCGRMLDCGGCQLPQTCAGGGAPNRCGSGGCVTAGCMTLANSTCNTTSLQCECNTGFHLCGSVCRSDTSVTSCGASCTPCSAPANASPTCSAGACGFTCNAGFTRCGNQCVASSARTLRHAGSTPVPFGPYALAIGRLNGDVRGDVAAAGPTGANVLLAAGDAGSFMLGQALTGPGGGVLHVRVADLNGGGQADIVTSHSGNANASVYYGDGTGTFSSSQTVAIGQSGSTNRGFEVGDFNGDGRLDLLGANYPWDTAVAPSTAGGGFLAPVSYSGLYVPRGAAVGDFNRDGRLDAVVTTMGFGGANVLWGGDGGFAGHQSLGFMGDGNAVVVADFDRDGRLDVALLDSSSRVQLLSGAADGGLAAPVPLMAMGELLASGDFDGDGRPDLVTGRGSEVTVLYNAGGFSQPRQVGIRQGSLEAAAVSLAAGDLDGDGVDDLAVGNAYHGAVEALLSSCSVQLQCGASLRCGSGEVCCFNVGNSALSCETPNGSLMGLGQRCPMPSVQSSMECAGQGDCGAAETCCGSGAVSQCAASCAATSRVCASPAECGTGETCCPQMSGPLKVCKSGGC